MNIYDKKTARLHKLNAWCSLALNVSLTLLVQVINKKHFDYRLLLVCFLLLLLSVSNACSRVSLEMSLKNYSVIYPYSGSFIISCFLIYETYISTNLALTMIHIMVIIIEILMIFVIIYRYKIRNKIIALFKKKKGKRT